MTTVVSPTSVPAEPPASLVIARLRNGREVTYPLPGRAPFLRFRFPGTRACVVLCLWHAMSFVGEQEADVPAEGAFCDECAIEAEAIAEREWVA